MFVKFFWFYTFSTIQFHQQLFPYHFLRERSNRLIFIILEGKAFQAFTRSSSWSPLLKTYNQRSLN